MFARIEITRNSRLNPAHPALQRETARSCLQILISESVYKVALRECTRWVHAKCERACRSPPHHKHLKLLSQGAGEDISLHPRPRIRQFSKRGFCKQPDVGARISYGFLS